MVILVDFVGKIESIRVAKAPHQTTFCFYVKRKGVKETDVSYLYPLDNPSKKTQVLTACREAIKFIVLDFRRKQIYPYKSAFSGKLIFSEDEAHVDHYDDTFCKVASDWIELNGGADVLFEDINDTEDNSSITEFKSKELRDSFVAYHNSHTHLRIVMKSENLSDLRRAYIRTMVDS